MKKTQLTITLTVILSYFLLFPGSIQGQNKTVSFSAKIENPNSDSIIILNPYMNNFIKTFYLKDGELKKDTFQIQMGYYRFDDGTEHKLCFFKPGFDLHLSLNAMEFDETVHYSGKGENSNNYLANKYLLEESMRYKNNYKYYARLEEKEFLSFTDSIYKLKLDFYNKHKSKFDEDFARLEVENLKTDYLTKIADYHAMHAFLTNNINFNVSPDFPDPFKNINLDDENLLLVPGYSHFVNLYIQKLTLNLLRENHLLNYYNTYVDLIDSLIQNKTVKDEMALYFGLYQFNNADDKEYCYNKLKAMVSNPEKLKPIEEAYGKIQKIKKGAPSPGFELYDIDSNLVRLEDFRGKIVYIDIWATWCSPCIKEFPSLHKLQTEFKDKNIVFISICERDDWHRWKAYVISKKLEGVQLFAEAENKFLSDYLVTGVPRFILIDENGLIINANALNPSSPKLKKQLEELL